MLAREAHKARFVDERKQRTTEIKPEQLLIPRRASEAGKRSVWDIGNIIQENIIAGGVTAMPASDAARRECYQKYVPSRPIREIARDVMLNRTVWELMEQAAKRAEGHEDEWSKPPMPGLPVFARG